ncbi:SpoIIE family protein phosphatase [Amycolatopsis sp. FBCC-B4732]|uniref:SpoIIE family protein phosphatase n=1 Tax=Amycolatopsis sp. FBCC-B4732 TaxID=3079339 RepID=UPI001FF228DC|nr:SpoIIE family protein phosphatase [Amycolatopsis sp. FBCC-B4732]UOX93071.1 SpoIIE family protein phosphatase [Amycolatopsis sp. FBCC-B4732]
MTQPGSAPVVPRGPSPAADADLQALFGQSTAVLASLAGPAHVLEAANPAFSAAIGGDRVRTGVPLGQLMPEPAAQGLLGHLDRVFRTGTPVTGRNTRVVIGSGGDAREAFFDFTCEPRRDAAGNVLGVQVIGVETTQVRHAQRLAAEHRLLLEQIARQAPLERVLDGMARTIEQLVPDVLVSVLLADDDGRRLRHGAAPSLPAFYNDAIDGITTGDGVGSCGTAAHRRTAVIVTDIASDPLWDDFRDLAGRAGLAACWSTPILGRDGRLLGTFAMYHRSPRAPKDSDLALAGIFTSTAALAIERHLSEQARVAAEAKEAAARADLAFLLEASTVLGGTFDHVRTLEHLAALCVPALAPMCTVDIVEDGHLRRVATAGTAGSRLPPPGDDATVTRVLATGTTEIARRAPATPGPWDELGVTGYVCVPLTERDRTFGVLRLLSTGDRELDGHAVALTEEVARRAASAARNARQYSQRAALARDLQAGLLMPDLPDVPGVDLATVYHPAGAGLEIGGDFYDVFPLAGEVWAFMLGDVCGRGATAATTTALVRHTARAVAPLLAEPTAIVAAIDRALGNRPHAHGTDFVTLVYGHLRPTPSGVDITLVRAGHNFPVLLTTDRRAHEIRVPGTLLGASVAVHHTAYELHLNPGDSLVLYTDGFLEARNGAREEFGEDRLLETLTAAPARPRAQDVIRRITAAVTAFAGDAAVDDDQAALVLTADPGGTTAPA